MKETVLNVDASGMGLGAVIMSDGKPVAFGPHVVVEIDHRLLEAIFKKPLNKAPPRLQRMLLKLTKYDLDVRYVPGKKQFISDCLSRAPISDTEPVSDPEEMIGINLIDTLCVDSSTLQKFREGHTLYTI